MSSSEEKKKKITLKKKKISLMSSDKVEFAIEEDVLMQLQTIKFMIEDKCAADTIPLPNVRAATLAQVLEYAIKRAQRHKDSADESTHAKATMAFHNQYMKMDWGSLFRLVMAADYLNFESLLTLASSTIADRIKDKTPEEVRTIFGIQSDFTPEEEEKMKAANLWAFQ